MVTYLKWHKILACGLLSLLDDENLGNSTLHLQVIKVCGNVVVTYLKWYEILARGLLSLLNHQNLGNSTLHFCYKGTDSIVPL